MDDLLHLTDDVEMKTEFKGVLKGALGHSCVSIALMGGDLDVTATLDPMNMIERITQEVEDWVATSWTSTPLPTVEMRVVHSQSFMARLKARRAEVTAAYSDDVAL